MAVQISVATDADTETLSALVGEIEEYYGGDPAPGDPQRIRTALFAGGPVPTVLLAREHDTVIGLASYSLVWPAVGADTSLYLKELYVRAEYRRRGVGSALFAELRAIAGKHGYSRIEWTADTSNPAATAFYEALGATPRDKIFFRVHV
ncbi:GNAT family N-acetyltransferase [Streptomyces sp. 8L]|uniref:GNAT family N-acetyltransferase n=1 Tax=Streptomyces sp. 8L TaxID=2877242 RepID=UPI001CD372C0|nr:GNAT family N-acetyltransferase [Streptomyces sp. 8L]MCA1217038.1 GNAT family N-acetyltransferase [Streptomyces sp. 8L]